MPSEEPTPLSQDASLVLMSLKDHPELGTPEAIVSQRHWVQQVSQDGAHEALRELETRSLARDVAGWWALTETGNTFPHAD